MKFDESDEGTQTRLNVLEQKVDHLADLMHQIIKNRATDSERINDFEKKVNELLESLQYYLAP